MHHTMPQVRLEILRHGPPHNQLLSPLVPYMVLCGDEPSASLQVQFEHRQLVRYLGELRYDLDRRGPPAPSASGDRDRWNVARVDAIRQLEELVGGVLGRVAPLTRALQNGSQKCTHLRLILSPRELAMLPFELARTMSGLPGDGPLLANPLLPVCLTREVRVSGQVRVQWPRKPRVLFIASSAGGAVPARAHAEALLRALDPWLDPIRFVDDDPKHRREPGTEGRNALAWSKRLTALMDPTLEEVHDAVVRANADGAPYSHVHILAHGGTHRVGVEDRFGLMLHDPSGVPTAVDGELIADALAGAPGSNPTVLPAVLTIASCDVGSAGGPLEPGAGLAHQLHVAGIPFVVASQYPLTKRGSVRLTETLYRALAVGVDPRAALLDARRRLFTEQRDNHDWASVVAYARLPADIDRQVESAALEAAMGAIREANAWGWEALVRQRAGHDRTGAWMKEAERRVRLAIEQAERLAARLEHDPCDPDGDNRNTDNLVALARAIGSAYKRSAERIYASQKHAIPSAPRDTDTARSSDDHERELRRSLTWYRMANDLDVHDHWSGSQVVALTLALGLNDGNRDDECVARWFAAELAARCDLTSPTRRTWALVDLIELYLTAPALRTLSEVATERATTGWEVLVRDLVKELGPDDLLVRTTVWQLQRYAGHGATQASSDDVGLLARKVPVLAIRAREMLQRLASVGVAEAVEASEGPSQRPTRRTTRRPK